MCHMHVLGLWELPDSKESVTEYMSTELRGGSALSVFQGSADKNTLIIKMTEVRVHAAFKVKDDPTFLKEAAKIVEATQVKIKAFRSCLISEKEANDLPLYKVLD